MASAGSDQLLAAHGQPVSSALKVSIIKGLSAFHGGSGRVKAAPHRATAAAAPRHLLRPSRVSLARASPRVAGHPQMRPYFVKLGVPPGAAVLQRRRHVHRGRHARARRHRGDQQRHLAQTVDVKDARAPGGSREGAGVSRGTRRVSGGCAGGRRVGRVQGSSRWVLRSEGQAPAALLRWLLSVQRASWHHGPALACLRPRPTHL